MIDITTMNVEYHFNLFTKLGARHAVERWTIRNRSSFGFKRSSHKDCDCTIHADTDCMSCTCTSCCYFDGNNRGVIMHNSAQQA